MTPGDRYRRRAAELKARAAGEHEWRIKSELEALARGYLRLANQADRNAVPSDIVYETPYRSPAAGTARGSV
jgi:hypothetical protein